MEKNRLILFKTFINVGFSEENDEINRIIERLITIALWYNVLNSENYRGMHVIMATVKRTLKIDLCKFPPKGTKSHVGSHINYGQFHINLPQSLRQFFVLLLISLNNLVCSDI